MHPAFSGQLVDTHQGTASAGASLHDGPWGSLTPVSHTLVEFPQLYCFWVGLCDQQCSAEVMSPFWDQVIKDYSCCLCHSWYPLFFFLLFFLFFTFTLLYWFCHISKWIRHRYTCVTHPEPSFLLPPHTIPLGRLSAPAPSIQYRASNLDWQLVSYMILYLFQCHSPKSSHPLPLPPSPKDCSIHQCLFCSLVYKVIVTIFLNSIYMR